MFRIISHPVLTHQWIVVAEWSGEHRTVYGPASLFECISYANN